MSLNKNNQGYIGDYDLIGDILRSAEDFTELTTGCHGSSQAMGIVRFTKPTLFENTLTLTPTTTAEFCSASDDDIP